MLINTFLPNFQFSEKHAIAISAPQDIIMNIIINNDPFTDKLTKTLMRIREIGRTKSKKTFGFDNFFLLGKQENKEVIYGLIGKFWQFNFGLVPVQSSLEFQQFSTKGIPKLVINFSIVETDANHSILSTETRVFCPDKKSIILFLPYWYLIRLASGLIRKRMLSHIKCEAEKKQSI